MLVVLNGRKAEVNWDGSGADEVYLTDGYWLDSEAELTDDELDQLGELYAGELYQEYIEFKTCEAEYMYGE